MLIALRFVGVDAEATAEQGRADAANQGEGRSKLAENQRESDCLEV